MTVRKLRSSCSAGHKSLSLQAIQQFLNRRSIANCPHNICIEANTSTLQPGWHHQAVDAWTSRLRRWTPRTSKWSESPVFNSIVSPIARVSLSGKMPLRQCQILTSSISNRKWRLGRQLCSWIRMSLFRHRHACRILFQSPGHCMLRVLKYPLLSSQSSVSRGNLWLVMDASSSNYYKFRQLMSHIKKKRDIT